MKKRKVAEVIVWAPDIPVDDRPTLPVPKKSKRSKRHREHSDGVPDISNVPKNDDMFIPPNRRPK